MRFDAILFDFDGVLIESEHAGNLHLAGYLIERGHPTTPEQAMAMFMGLAGGEFVEAVERWTGAPLPPDFQDERRRVAAQAMRDGVPAVAGAIAFLETLPAAWPIAVVSSSSTQWIAAHLTHLGLRERFGAALFSGGEHVARGKPAPDLYLHAAERLGVDIGQTVVIEDSPIGASGAVASGAFVIGLCAGKHCPPDHGDVLLGLGVDAIAADFDEVQRIVSASPGDI